MKPYYIERLKNLKNSMIPRFVGRVSPIDYVIYSTVTVIIYALLVLLIFGVDKYGLATQRVVAIIVVSVLVWVHVTWMGVLARRFRDSGLSGWWALVGTFPVVFGFIPMLIMIPVFLESTRIQAQVSVRKYASFDERVLAEGIESIKTLDNHDLCQILPLLRELASKKPARVRKKKKPQAKTSHSAQPTTADR